MRACSVCSHPRAAEISRDIAQGVVVGQLVKKWTGLTDASIRRHIKAHVSASILQELRANEHVGSPDLIERLVEALEDASIVRASALLTGQSNVVLRAAATTQALVATLLDKLGVGSLEVSTLLAEGEQLARAVGRATRADPRVGQAIAAELRAGSDDHEMADRLDLVAATALAA